MQIETDRLYIRQLTEEDRGLMARIWAERCPSMFDSFSEENGIREKFLQEMWKTTQEPNLLTGIIFLRNGGQFCGRVNIQKTDQEVPEVGIDIVKDLQNQGYGPEAVAGFANWYGESRRVSKIKALIAAGNAHSTHVFEKMGAVYVQDNLSFLKIAEDLAKDLPGKREDIFRDLKVREYILKLPISYP